jgi:hypothetical protein
MNRTASTARRKSSESLQNTVGAGSNTDSHSHNKHLASGITDWPVKIVNPEIEDIFKTSGKEAAAKQLLKDLSEDYTSSTSTAEVEARPWFGRCVWEADNDVCDGM